MKLAQFKTIFSVWVLVGIMGITLSACGFKFRGAQSFPQQYKYALIQGTAEFSPLGKILKQYIGSAGLKLTSTMSTTDLVLIVKRDEFKRRVLSVNSAGGANEYELTYELVMHANNNQGVVLAENMSVTLVRNYNFDPNNVLAKSDEETTLKLQMQQLAVQQVLRQLSVRLTRLPVETKPSGDTQPATLPVETNGNQPEVK